MWSGIRSAGAFIMGEQSNRAKSIFLEAIEDHVPEQWPAFVEQACADDIALRAEVEKLLLAQSELGSFHEMPRQAQLVCGHAPVSERPGTVIGAYKLLEQLGEGGFGIVFMAEQQQPVRRKVALKVVKPGMDTRQVIARFEAERQALALMDHPNIARVLDAGATESGRPYFVMELIRGIPITQFCDENRLTPRERLVLFVTVCQAIQHAHQKGIIHRDLKPTNVLVTLLDGTPVVKVIDFGIAKALGQERLTDKTLFTGFAHMIGTPLYMSPEQAEMSGQDADTRTDIYSLGVLLYELLTGTTPFDKDRLKGASYDEIRRIIREEEPAKPSTRISTLGQAATMVSANRQSEPKRLSQLFRGELDWIVMKALEKDRNRRYETASAFAADVQRYLHDEPVQAFPPSAAYRFRKFVRRHKAGLMTASAIAFTILLAVAGLAVSSGLIWQANRELRQNLYYQNIALAEREWSANNLGRMAQLLEECPADLRGWEWHYLKRLRYKTFLPLRHDTMPFCVAYSPTGQCLASASQDGVINVWDAHTGQALWTFPTGQKQVFSVAFSPDGQRLASAGSDGSVKIWNVQDGKQLDGWHAHTGPVRCVAFSPDGRRLATTSSGSPLVEIWDAATGVEIFNLEGHALGVLGVAFSPDGRRLATAGYDKTVKVWDATTGRLMVPCHGHIGSVNAVAFSPDGRYVASVSGEWATQANGEVMLHNAHTGEECLRLRGHTGFLLSVAFSPDGRYLASAGMDMTVKLWHVPTGIEALTLRGHGDLIRAVAFSPDGYRLVSAGEDRTVRTWDAKPLTEFEPKGHLTLRGHGAGVFGVAFQPDGKRVATASVDGTVKVWDAQTGEPGLSLRGRGGCFWSVAFSPDGRQLVAGGWELRLWDAADGRDLRSVHGHTNLVCRVAFSRNGRFFVSTGYDKTVRIWDATSCIHPIPAHDFAIVGLAISPDGRCIASASVDDTVKIWDATTGKMVIDLKPRHASCPNSVAFAPDGELLASASRDGTIKLWDTRTWQEKRVRCAILPGG
jgi:WD40 repeat protein/serine/threonine protein kinase